MENPLGWNEFQKCISFHMSDMGDGIVDNVVRGLISDNHLKEDQYDAACRIVALGLKKFDKQMKAQICGLSSISIIYRELQEAKLLK